jgi:glutamyl-tRNA(Gln) amidotransferase subunit E
MYPETDIPPQPITQQLVEEVKAHLPEPAEKKLQRLTKQYALNDKLGKQLIDSEYLPIFEEIAKTSGVQASTVAAFLTETVKALQREGVHTEHVSDDQIRGIFKAVGTGELAKEAIADVFSWLSKNPDKAVSDAVAALGFTMLSSAELEAIVDRVIAQNKAQIEKLGGGAFGLVMGLTMKEARGKANPAAVSQAVKSKLK